MDILDDMGVSKLSVFLKVNYSFNICPTSAPSVKWR